jgi:glycerol-3-phosphate dehydrogenase
VCAAWDAALRGLAVALVEQADFAGATSANSFKIVHGGIRYLQHADFPRLRSSCKERSAFLRIAPHLVSPLPIVIPTYGHWVNGKTALGVGLWLYELLTLDRNRDIRDVARRIPPPRFIGRKALLEMYPGLNEAGLTGGALFYDGQMYNPPRLALSFLQSAVEHGAVAVNYVGAEELLRRGQQIIGVEARDRLSGERFPILAKTVLNAAGPWAESLLIKDSGIEVRAGTYSRDACFVVRRRLSGAYGLALQGRTRDPDAVLSRAARHLFLVPWREYTLVGVWHKVYAGDPDTVAVTEDELESFVQEVNWAYPALDLSLADVMMVNTGLVPFGENQPGAVDLRYGKRSHLIDHERLNGVKGLVTLIGIRYTMGRADAARAVDLIVQKLGAKASRPATDKIPIHGGDISSFDALLSEAQRDGNLGLGEATLRAVLQSYGSRYKDVLKHADGDSSLRETIGESTVLKAQVVHAIRKEMAMKLSDVVLRRTELASAGHPGSEALHTCAALMAAELGWNKERVISELRELEPVFPRHRQRAAPQ